MKFFLKLRLLGLFVTALLLVPLSVDADTANQITKFDFEPTAITTTSQFTIFLPYDLAHVHVVDLDNNPISDAEVHLVYVIENGATYRYDWLIKNTDNSGDVIFTEKELRTAIQPKIGRISSPFPVFLEIYKDGYMDTFVNADPATEKPMIVSSKKTWEVIVKMPTIQPKLSMQSGQFSAYYYPGQEKCAQIGVQKLAQFYPHVVNVLGSNPSPKAPLSITFDTKRDTPLDWTGGSAGIHTKCQPWTSNIADPSIENMWNNAIPHEFLHVLISDLFLTSWANEGLAQYTSHISNNVPFSCDPANYLAVQDLTGGNIPYYETASCFWKGLEDQNHGFIKSSIVQLQAILGQHIGFGVYSTKDFMAKVLIPVLVNDYKYTQQDAENYVNTYMTQFHYDPNKF